MSLPVNNKNLGKSVFFLYATNQYIDSVTEEEGDYLSDTLDTAIYGFTITCLLVGEGLFYRAVGYSTRGLFFTPYGLAAVIPVVVGGVFAYVIDEDEGLDNYGDFLEDVVTLDIGSTSDKLEFTAETILNEGPIEIQIAATNFIIDAIDYYKISDKKINQLFGNTPPEMFTLGS